MLNNLILEVFRISLKTCNHLFYLIDFTFPLIASWVAFFISVDKNMKVAHLLYFSIPYLHTSQFKKGVGLHLVVHGVLSWLYLGEGVTNNWDQEIEIENVDEEGESNQ